MKVTFIPIANGILSTVTEGLSKGVEDLELRGNCCIIKIGQNTEKSSGDMRRLSHSERPSANTDVKIFQGVNNNNNKKKNNTPER